MKSHYLKFLRRKNIIIFQMNQTLIYTKNICIYISQHSDFEKGRKVERLINIEIQNPFVDSSRIQLFQ